MVRSDEAFRSLAHHLYADEPLVQERQTRPGSLELTTQNP